MNLSTTPIDPIRQVLFNFRFIMPHPFQSPLLSALRRAMQGSREVQEQLCPSDALDKEDRSPVTVADLAVQIVISHALHEIDPDTPLVGEEDPSVFEGEGGSQLRTRLQGILREQGMGLDESELGEWLSYGSGKGGGSGAFWTLDPIDGTKGFLRHGQYALALARIEDGRVVQSFLGCPNLASAKSLGEGSLFYAIRGGGAWEVFPDGSSSPVQVSANANPGTCRFCESVESGHSDHHWSSSITRSLGSTTEPLRMDSQCKYGAVARGDADVYLRLPTRPGYVERIWDHAAGCLLVEEAGGTVTDIT
ncbi:MAG: 3'(2'),5'-bisphosphate nucleotidase, partial [Candidatus Omnitrophica bacterium]|nr:3'(2'),5'-bisphosphate nucleotidase [Candidatus Omnitrophota bacterium]